MPSRSSPRPASASTEPRSDARPALLALVAALLLAVLLSACGDASGAPDGEALAAAPDAGGEPAPAVSEKVRTVFRPLPAGPESVGGVLHVLVPVGGVSGGSAGAPRLHVEIEGLAPGLHAWAVYRAPCDEPEGPVEVALSTLPGHTGLGAPLRADEEGRVDAEQAVPPLRRIFEEAGTFSVRVHAGSDLEAGHAVACAPL